MKVFIQTEDDEGFDFIVTSVSGVEVCGVKQVDPDTLISTLNDLKALCKSYKEVTGLNSVLVDVYNNSLQTT